MISSQGERIPLIKSVLAGQQVEQWLISVETLMKMTTHAVTIKAYEDYKKQDRAKWMVDRCGMAVLCISMTYWTSEVETAIEENSMLTYV